MAEDFTEDFNTFIPEELQPAFERWVALKDAERAKQGRGSILQDKADYDIQGFFLAEMKGEEVIFDEATGHGTDFFKKPNHPTFSTDSRYHGISGFRGGTFKGNSFSPSEDNIKLFGAKNLRRYMEKFEPNVILEPIGVFSRR